ncbi:CDF family cation-efflux transporter FieF [Thaumasiovibrio subtropicus]|uniref:CDF family cation-efflux transporter FieF n=1 Tax=Thaumasiovibrio subtropicus TaxID=1891207 RepID=UPI000B361DF1|nr:CDF family cation-efflux transporter FieF [Thaumasiovibrio subtropicus]
MTSQYARLVQTAAWAATLVATLLMLVKLGAWWHTGSVTMLASLVDSLLDMAASVTNLIVVRYALQPADEEHTFGHGKAESLAALAQAMFITGSAFFLLLNGFERLFRPQDLVEPGYGVAVSAFAIVVTLLLVTFQQYVVKKTGSQAIAADSLHYQSDLYMNVAIMVALGLSWWGWGQADALFAIGIGVYIIKGALMMGYDAVQTLLDRQLPAEEVDKIEKLACGVRLVKGVHQVRTRQSGPVKFIQLHLELDDDLKLVDAHRVADQVEDLLEVAFPGADIMIHQDPVSVVDTKREHKGDIC